LWVLYNASNRASGFQKLLRLRCYKSQLSEMVLALLGQESTVLPHIGHQRWIYLAVAHRTVLSKGYVAPKRRLQNFIYIYQSRQVPPPSKSTVWTQLTQQPPAPRPHGCLARPALASVAPPCAPPSCCGALGLGVTVPSLPCCGLWPTTPLFGSGLLGGGGGGGGRGV